MTNRLTNPTNWLLGIFAASIITASAWVGNTVIRLDKSVSTLLEVYRIESSLTKEITIENKKSIKENSTQISENRKMLDKLQMYAKKEEDEYGY